MESKDMEKYAKARQKLIQGYNKHKKQKKDRSTILLIQPNIEYQIKFRKRSDNPKRC